MSTGHIYCESGIETGSKDDSGLVGSSSPTGGDFNLYMRHARRLVYRYERIMYKNSPHQYSC